MMAHVLGCLSLTQEFHPDGIQALALVWHSPCTHLGSELADRRPLSLMCFQVKKLKQKQKYSKIFEIKKALTQ